MIEALDTYYKWMSYLER